MIIKELIIDNKRKITFKNEIGLNIIIGNQGGKSANGVGKSLFIAFIRYAFGSNSNLHKNLKKYHERLNIDNVNLLVKNNQANEILLQQNINEESPKDNIPKMIFPQTNHLTNKIILSRFVRDTHSYEDYLKNSYKKENSEATQKVIAFLLGLDIKMIDDRISLRSKLKTLQAKEKELKVFIKKQENEVGIDKREKEKHDNNLKQVKIAENYTIILKENNQFVKTLQDKRNILLKLEYELQAIEKSLYITEDLTFQDIKDFFDEVNIQIPNTVSKRLSDVELFNRNLINDRQNVLKSQKINITNELQKIKEEISELEIKVDNNFKYLKEHQAIDEYIAIQDKINRLEIKLEHFENEKKQLSKIKSEILNLKNQIAEEDIKTDDFLEKKNADIDKIITSFAEIVESIYKTNCGNLIISKHEGKSESNRYNFIANINKDDSNGINNVKIFCWDWLLFLIQKQVSIDFLCHDSKIFDGVDPVQIKAMIKFAKEQCIKNKKQYIVCMNYSDFEYIKDDINEEQDVILRLSDNTTDELLLKQEIDGFKY
jgi:uncharacterized protein YydD (DUF2326 family)